MPGAGPLKLLLSIRSAVESKRGPNKLVHNKPLPSRNSKALFRGSLKGRSSDRRSRQTTLANSGGASPTLAPAQLLGTTCFHVLSWILHTVRTIDRILSYLKLINRGA
jgi:hypothetical protein